MLNFVTMFVLLLLAVSVHEVCHGWAALRLGDDTAYYAGRLTLNPIAHIDLIGTILLPVLLYLGSSRLMGPEHAFYFGWAKPVPVNPLRFRRDITLRTGMSIVAAAGPLSNILLALLFAGVFHAAHGTMNPYAVTIRDIAIQATIINLFLAFFNFIPIPPLDGSKVLLHFLHPNTAYALMRLEPYGFVLILVLFNWTPLGGLVSTITFGALALLGIR